MSNKPDQVPNITGLILAGGLARRMAGQDKGLLQLADSRLVEHCISALSPQVSRIFISANRNLEQYQKTGLPVLQDASDNYEGPLAGLQRALEESPDMPVLVVPCDAPLLSGQLKQHLFDAYCQGDYLAAIPHDGTRLQPLFGLFSPTALASLNHYLESGQRKVETWVTSLPHTVVDLSDQADSFMNINSEEDLHRVAAILESDNSC